MIVVDTSVWVASFRGRDQDLADRLSELLDGDEVFLPAPVRVELLSGASKRTLPLLRRTLSALPVLFPGRETWQLIEDWLEVAVRSGDRFSVGDLLIAALANENSASLWSLDGDFARMAKLRWISLYS